ncbi:hypothetical protein H2201_007158 [Coniosporium apollinis]|uniref:Uncharacterized protein n=1 Tax=Coniosporium apollinis TaxID=61459 RepID=A0ABQ9NKI5_9PEZI|nr:hypothetical protein H2201_007158 [Coniosporium apollinis]
MCLHIRHHFKECGHSDIVGFWGCGTSEATSRREWPPVAQFPEIANHVKHTIELHDPGVWFCRACSKHEEKVGRPPIVALHGAVDTIEDHDEMVRDEITARMFGEAAPEPIYDVFVYNPVTLARQTRLAGITTAGVHYSVRDPRRVFESARSAFVRPPAGLEPPLWNVQAFPSWADEFRNAPLAPPSSLPACDLLAAPADHQAAEVGQAAQPSAASTARQAASDPSPHPEHWLVPLRDSNGRLLLSDTAPVPGLPHDRTHLYIHGDPSFDLPAGRQYLRLPDGYRDPQLQDQQDRQVRETRQAEQAERALVVYQAPRPRPHLPILGTSAGPVTGNYAQYVHQPEFTGYQHYVHPGDVRATHGIGYQIHPYHLRQQGDALQPTTAAHPHAPPAMVVVNVGAAPLALPAPPALLALPAPPVHGLGPQYGASQQMVDVQVFPGVANAASQGLDRGYGAQGAGAQSDQGDSTGGGRGHRRGRGGSYQRGGTTFYY